MTIQNNTFQIKDNNSTQTIEDIPTLIDEDNDDDDDGDKSSMDQATKSSASSPTDDDVIAPPPTNDPIQDNSSIHIQFDLSNFSENKLPLDKTIDSDSELSEDLMAPIYDERCEEEPLFGEEGRISDPPKSFTRDEENHQLVDNISDMKTSMADESTRERRDTEVTSDTDTDADDDDMNFAKRIALTPTVTAVPQTDPPITMVTTLADSDTSTCPQNSHVTSEESYQCVTELYKSINVDTSQEKDMICISSVTVSPSVSTAIDGSIIEKYKSFDDVHCAIVPSLIDNTDKINGDDVDKRDGTHNSVEEIDGSSVELPVHQGIDIGKLII